MLKLNAQPSIFVENLVTFAVFIQPLYTFILNVYLLICSSKFETEKIIFMYALKSLLLSLQFLTKFN